jgi:hypothetical protein
MRRLISHEAAVDASMVAMPVRDRSPWVMPVRQSRAASLPIASKGIMRRHEAAIYACGALVHGR